MSFPSLTFLTLFLPISVGVFHLIPARFPQVRRLWLLVASLAFLALGDPLSALLLTAQIVWTMALCRFDAHHRGEASGTIAFVCCVVLDIGLLGVFKYTGLVLSTLQGITAIPFDAPIPALPIGISFFTFQGISYAVDVHRGAEPEDGIVRLGLLLAFFPKLVSGPLVRYEDFSAQLEEPTVTLDGFCAGVGRAACGLAKKMLLANRLGAIVDQVFNAQAAADMPSVLLWIASLAFALQLFVDFSSYTDMAVGLGAMFGIRLPENFDDPYLARDAVDFWRRWHITLSEWFRDYVYIPLGGSRGTTASTIRNLIIVWALTGLWHGAAWTFVLWGLGWGCLIILERFAIKPRERSAVVQGSWRVLVLLSAMLLWTVFRIEDPSTLGIVFTRMFLPRVWMEPTWRDPLTLVILHDEWPYLLVSILLAAGLPKAVLRALPSEGRLRDCLETVGMLALTALCILAFSTIAQGNYDPFLYAGF